MKTLLLPSFDVRPSIFFSPKPAFLCSLLTKAAVTASLCAFVTCVIHQRTINHCLPRPAFPILLESLPGIERTPHSSLIVWKTAHCSKELILLPNHTPCGAHCAYRDSATHLQWLSTGGQTHSVLLMQTSHPIMLYELVSVVLINISKSFTTWCLWAVYVFRLGYSEYLSLNWYPPAVSHFRGLINERAEWGVH